jgi:hypothetical protein
MGFGSAIVGHLSKDFDGVPKETENRHGGEVGGVRRDRHFGQVGESVGREFVGIKWTGVPSGLIESRKVRF